MKRTPIQIGNRDREPLESGMLKTTAADLLRVLGFNGKRWNDDEDILQVLTDLEGEPVASETASERIKELLADGRLGQRVHSDDRLRQFIVA